MDDLYFQSLDLLFSDCCSVGFIHLELAFDIDFKFDVATIVFKLVLTFTLCYKPNSTTNIYDNF